MITSDGYLRHLERAADAFAGVLDRGELGAAVPGCPGWTLTDLAHHLGGVHRWATTAIVEGRPGDDGAGDAPQERAALARWYRDGAGELLDVLRRTPPETECWAFGPRPRTAAFWFRRQANETAVHARDAARSQGGTRAIDAELALDGVDEIVGMFYPRQVRLGRVEPVARPVALVTDGGRWVLGDGDPVVEVAGGAETLLLLLWRRLRPGEAEIEVTGDRAALDELLALAITP